MKKITIGVTDCSKYANYAKWIAQEPDVVAIKLSYKDDNFADIAKCQGILLSGGEDVHPTCYDRLDYLSYCYPDDIDQKRDEFELKVLHYTQEKRLPVFGICRGLQVANVFFGGTLIPDIPTFKNSDHSKIDGADRYHEIRIETSSQLRKLTRLERGEVNSAHHQCVDKLGEGLVASAFSQDGIIEGIERQYPDGAPMLLLVQWHPERMNDQESVFSKTIRQSFLDPIRALSD